MKVKELLSNIGYSTLIGFGITIEAFAIMTMLYMVGLISSISILVLVIIFVVATMIPFLMTSVKE